MIIVTLPVLPDLPTWSPPNISVVTLYFPGEVLKSHAEVLNSQLASSPVARVAELSAAAFEALRRLPCCLRVGPTSKKVADLLGQLLSLPQDHQIEGAVHIFRRVHKMLCICGEKNEKVTAGLLRQLSLPQPKGWAPTYRRLHAMPPSCYIRSHSRHIHLTSATQLATSICAVSSSLLTHNVAT